MFQTVAQHLISSGFTTYSLARAMGVSQPTASRLASGKRTNINAEAGLRLIRAAGGDVRFPEGLQVLVDAEGTAIALDPPTTEGAPPIPQTQTTEVSDAG